MLLFKMECLQENIFPAALRGYTQMVNIWVYEYYIFWDFLLFFSFGIKLNYFEEIHTQTHLQSWISTRILFNASPKKIPTCLLISLLDIHIII